MDKLIIKTDLHIHSNTSFDSFVDPIAIIRKAKELGISLIAFTEHNKLLNNNKLDKFAKKCGIKLIKGEEIKTSDADDIIALFISDSIPKNLTVFETINAIREQNGLIVYPHPFKRSFSNIDTPRKIAKYVDIIEGINGRTSVKLNIKAQKLAKAMNKPIVGSSDSHFLFEFGHVYTKFWFSDDVYLMNDDELIYELMHAKRIIVMKRNYPFMEAASQIIKMKKTRSIRKYPKIMRSILISMGKEILKI